MQCINLELLSYVLTFVASNIARYRPAPWKKVIEGSEELSSRMHQRTEDAYSHYIRGNQVLTYYLDKECSFLYNIKTILDFPQNETWIRDQFIGSFVLSKSA